MTMLLRTTLALSALLFSLHLAGCEDDPAEACMSNPDAGLTELCGVR